MNQTICENLSRIRRSVIVLVIFSIAATALSALAGGRASACSTFMLKKGGELLYGHNLNEGDMGVPGMIFVNKRGVFKEGRTFMELITKDGDDPSTLTWISRYGSVTCNNFGRDLPDGGINEAGLYIWEMNEEADYPQNDSLPKIMHANWMQYVLDNCACLDEAIASTSEIMLDGWTWHYFIGDMHGNTAALAFIDGEVVVHRGEDMPVPGLFNTPYAREMELLGYYEGFGGLYEPTLDDPKVPRFVKTAVMAKEYDPKRDAVRYGFYMLDRLQVYDVPEWSVLIDVRRMDFYFKTRINPEVKRFSIKEIDFSNRSPVLVLNMDFETSESKRKKNGTEISHPRPDYAGVGKGRNVGDLLHPFSYGEVYGLIESLTVLPGMPEEFFTRGGLTVEGFVERFAGHYRRAESKDRQPFADTWKYQGDEDSSIGFAELVLVSDGAAVSGEISLSKEAGSEVPIDHIKMVGSGLTFTFHTKSGSLIEVEANLAGDSLQAHFHGTESYYGMYLLRRVD